MSMLRGFSGVALRAIVAGRDSRVSAAIYHCIPQRWKDMLRRALMRRAAGDVAARDEDADVPQPALRRPIDPRFANQGVDCIGYVRAELGLGENVRSYARALDDAGYPFCLLDFEADIPGRHADRSLDAWIQTQPRYPVRLCFVNADRIERVTRRWPNSGGYTIGYWFWELERFPQAWLPAFEHVDEVWVPTTFVRDSVAAATDKPVTVIPMAIEFEPPRAVARRRFGLPDDAFVFFFNFDFHSYPERKSPRALIHAFRAAFPRSRHDVRLVIKTTNGDRMEAALEQVLIEASRDPRISIRDGYVGREEMFAWIACADAYVSLHRAEGFGLGLAEAMYLGKPVIATAWSGNTDFMSEREACLIDYSLIEVPPEAYPHWQGQRWAEPDIDQAARAMRRLADDPAAAIALGAAGQARIRRQYARSACAAAVTGRLQAIAATRDPTAPRS